MSTSLVDPAVIFEDVWKLYRRGTEIVTALGGVSLTIGRGEVVVLRGHSGSGKSTLLNLAGGLDSPTKGSVRAFGQDLSKLDRGARGQFRREKVGFVFQELVLIPHLTIRENVALPLAFDLGGWHAAIQHAVRLLGELGILAKADHMPREASYGERQRAAIARALIRKPELILADEPTANLDDENAERFAELVRSLGTTTIIATHDDRLNSLVSRTVRFTNGRIA